MMQQSFLYNFLLSPRYRIGRYITLVFLFSIVSFNQALVSYEEIERQIGSHVYWIVAANILIYLVTVYVVFKWVLPYLTDGRYGLFILCILLCALLFDAFSNIVFVLFLNDYDFFSVSTIIDNVSGFVLYILCVSGVIIPVFIRNWVQSNQQLSRLKIRQETSQVEQLKEQINPGSFFKILRRSGSLVKSDPDKSSAMLMKLSQLLRYQLYDCNRSQVLLTAEVSFLRNFLDLEKLYTPSLEYSFTLGGSMSGVFVPPTILLPYVQSAVNAFEDTSCPHGIDVNIDCQVKAIGIVLVVSGLSSTGLLEKELSKVRERLDTLYRNGYTLTVEAGGDAGKIHTLLTLDKM